MWRIVRAEASTLETKVAVWSLRRRDWARKLRYRDRMFFVANIDNPVGKKNLVAIRVGGFSVGQHKSAIQNSAINGVEGDAHSGVLRGRFESTDFALFFRVAQIKNDETVAAESSVSAITAVFQFFGDIHGTVQAGEGSLVLGHSWRHQFGPDPLVVLGLFAFTRAGHPPHGDLGDIAGVG